MIKKLITHNGTFHTDDVFAYAVLKQVYPLAKLTRTRDLSIIVPSEENIIFDVGMIYDPEQNCFDHHMKDAPLRDNGVPYSSAGLIWKYFGKSYIEINFPELDMLTIDKIHYRLDNFIFERVDKMDNGVGVIGDEIGFHHIISSVAEIDMGTTDPDKIAHFKYCSNQIANLVIMGSITKSIKAIEDEDAARKVITDEKARFVVFDKPNSSWASVAYDDRFINLLYVVAPNEKNEWELTALNLHKGTFQLRMPLPEEWCGKVNEELSEVIGISDAIFCHRNGFFALAKSKESIMKMLKIALRS